MSGINYHSSNTSSYLNWPFDHQIKVRQQHDGVIFENVANQYVKGEEITAYFTISHSTKVNPDGDQIGLIRIGCTNVKKCLSYSSVQFNSSITSESIRHGKAIFPSTLIANDDEFYQFCYINNKTKILGLSIPFQLNCTLDDIDLLSSKKHMLTEEKLHQENTKDIIHPCNQYQTECLRCRMVEEAHTKTLNEVKQIRSQLNVTLQLTKDQATQIIDLEHHLMKSNQLTKTSNQDKIKLEQELRDLHLTFEKYQRSMQGQLNQLTKTSTQDKIKLEQELRDLHLTSEKYQRSMQGQLNQLERNNKLLKEELNSLKTDDDLTHNQEAYIGLKASYNVIEKRCIKHQKIEIDLKRQLNNYENSINDLQHEIQYLTERLSTSTDEYKILFHKYNILERKIERNNEQEKVNTKNVFIGNEKPLISLYNTYENDQEKKSMLIRRSFANIEMRQCPICNFIFPQHFTVDGKQEHINQHFE